MKSRIVVVLFCFCCYCSVTDPYEHWRVDNNNKEVVDRNDEIWRTHIKIISIESDSLALNYFSVRSDIINKMPSTHRGDSKQTIFKNIALEDLAFVLSHVKKNNQDAHYELRLRVKKIEAKKKDRIIEAIKKAGIFKYDLIIGTIKTIEL